MGNTVKPTITNCTQCKYHCVLPDPDPNDWFEDDDVKVICRKANKNITVACRPHHTEAECAIPDWCPLLEKENDTGVLNPLLNCAGFAIRSDSGDPIKFAKSVIEQCKRDGIDLKTVTLAFTDGLTINDITHICRVMKNQIKMVFTVIPDIGYEVSPENVVYKLQDIPRIVDKSE